MLLLTDVEAVFSDWGGGSARPIGATTVAELRALDLDPGTMGAKVEAACGFVDDTGGFAGIGRLQDAAAILAGTTGTRLGGA